MNTSEMAERKKQIAQEASDYEQKAAERKKLLEAYSIVEADMAKKTSNPQQIALPVTDHVNGSSQTPTTPQVDSEYGKNSKQVEWAITMMREPYSIRELKTFLQSSNMEMTTDEISSVLSRFQRLGKIEVHEKGAGRRPTFYKPLPIFAQQ